ncbi:MAG: 2-phospho-L-lactate transferase [Anaerolineaceae bacterium]
MKITALAGGVGGAKLADGLARCLSVGELTVIVNIGDDFDYFGLHICPDLDTVCYTLAGLSNPDTGWGRSNESWVVLDNISRLGGPAWFHLGDQDIATHLERTRRLKAGESLTQIVKGFCSAWGIGTNVLPMSDQDVRTIVKTKSLGELEFQDYFVRNHCEPKVTGFRFKGIETAAPAPGVIDAIRQADYIIICPSNPWVSIAPILSVPGIRQEITKKTVVAVSPIIGGQAVKGPAAKMFRELGLEASAMAVAEQYRDFLKGFVLDTMDTSNIETIKQWGIIPLVSDTLMKTIEDRQRLASEILSFCCAINK